MKIINDIGSYTERVSVTPIALMPGRFSLRVESRYRDSRNPEEWRTIYQTTCNRTGLGSIVEEIYNVVTEEDQNDQSVLRSPPILRVSE